MMPIEDAKVAIILVNFNGADDTVECLDSILEHATECQTIVVDNGSSGDDVGRIKSAHPWVELIEAGSNLGFTGGNNLAIVRALEARVPWVFFLNNDTVIAPGAIESLIGIGDSSPEWGILAPRMDYYDHPGEPWFAGSELDLKRGIAVHNNTTIPNAVTELPWITGCAMFCRAEMLRQLGGFDDRYFLNWEDVDLSLRARSNGWKLGIVPDALILHKVSRSLNRMSHWATYYWTRNRLLWLREHAGGKGRWRATKDSLQNALRAVVRHEPGAWSALHATVRGCADHFANRHGPR